MARNPYTGLCLQRCANADALVTAIGAATASSSVLVAAMLQGAVFQLYSAYLMHLRDIAISYSCAAPADIWSARQLLDILRESDKVPAEASEMDALVEEHGSWLARCLAVYRALLEGVEPQSVQVSHGGIDVRQQHDVILPFTLQEVRVWVDSMNELLERHSALMFEY